MRLRQGSKSKERLKGAKRGDSQKKIKAVERSNLARVAFSGKTASQSGVICP